MININKINEFYECGMTGKAETQHGYLKMELEFVNSGLAFHG